ncbi:chloramphenicol-sensitive protein RarD [Natronincola peptidivorans]|uniref:Chloramphenicol-sensitive protein RarD n=1 Tax=Natronincola peptidivorans TaxID=426128 RepID=A0A1I0BQK0_9FIRM|nr:EamA family transporter RarD [Natronincola peptidivorans]SET09170.1 chloramphenicol-sensitive protein RarD [Natronincola peptidivorans]
MGKNETAENRRFIGVLLVVGAFIIWGFLPLYWKLLQAIPADEILAHRILWSCVFLFFVLLYKKRLASIKEVFGNKKNVVLVTLCAITISINWFLYIWAVNSNYLVEASMGYYINPLVVVTLAMVVLKEKLNAWQITAIALAAVGVLIITLQYGEIPWIALTLAVSFGLYGLLKKLVQVDSITGLMLETIMLMPIALGYVLFKEFNGTGALTVIPTTTLLILTLAGVATATPLLMFSEAAKRVPLSMMGFAQYIAPTISLFLGVFVYKEAFTKVHFFSFGFIWLGLLIYSYSQAKALRKHHSKEPAHS